ncbi:MAG: NADH:ubiquinone reductase (Na(+)-transporting) subunit B [Bacteroidaceae bacterium]|nr:NADH:ubiquinone reductase (Na(+)-transporting) subunit B [Candidatus Minthousia equi]MCQ2245419.1 NADH:ubiquinone reductase (Na(+)-transporting) subunit B [Bacteroidaceae bacterium]MDO4957047.1 NADH:ubiquinone reductase (Na(+)-transporting) subunit B [Bacteroidales bacterium]
MAFIKNILDKMKPTFSEGGKLSAFGSLFDAIETFFYVPNETAKSYGAHIHDAIDSKRSIFFVIIAMIPAILFGMWNIGSLHYAAIGEATTLFGSFFYGLGVMLPKIVVSYAVGLGIEIAVAQWKKEEVHEGFFVTGILIPMIVPVNCPLWIIAIATAFAVIFAKEVFGGTGMNIFNPALVTRAFLFFAYPAMMSGDKVWVNQSYMDSIGGPSADALTAATPLGQLGAGETVSYDAMDTIIGTIPGSIGETSFVAIMIGAVILIWAGIASWKIIVSTFVGGALLAYLCGDAADLNFQWWEHLTVGGFAFGAVFMATDPVTACRTEGGKWIYGFIIGALAIIIRQFNPGYPEGMMMAILMGNLIAPLIDYCFVQSNINKRMKRAK